MAPQEDPRINDWLLPESSRVVCPVCLHHNEPEVPFCVGCGAPLGAVANVDPIQQIHSEGFAFRAAADGPPHGLILAGTWLIMLPMAGTAFCMLVAGNAGEGGLPGKITGIILLLLSLGVLCRATANFVMRKRALRMKRKGNEVSQTGCKG